MTIDIHGTDRDGTAATLREELEHFKQEKEKIREVVGQIGGKGSTARDEIATWLFILALGLLFLLDMLRNVLEIDLPLPELFSLQIGVLLVSIKIIWMIHKQSKVEHFQFWVLSSLEFRMNDIAKTLRTITTRLESADGEAAEKKEPQA